MMQAGPLPARVSRHRSGTLLWKEMELLSGQVGLREKFSEGLKTWLAGIMAQTECRREVIIRDEEGAAYPHVQEAPEGEWSVLVERTEVARCSTLEEALLLVGVSFYVFNQKPRTKYSLS
ncbi:hypothetical protein FJT64_012795 [Amphibalanus amphitrite]|uniref:Uncharacterized protein n=1 Tax=Amphibalanus amphitrite TaxID=1232801 RepID=A0A6A4UYJ4_AMPAM|nr:hypothetical protein FJT64_012795 [Amphibalanus amphitrite]